MQLNKKFILTSLVTATILATGIIATACEGLPSDVTISTGNTTATITASEKAPTDNPNHPGNRGEASDNLTPPAGMPSENMTRPGGMSSDNRTRPPGRTSDNMTPPQGTVFSTQQIAEALGLDEQAVADAFTQAQAELVSAATDNMTPEALMGRVAGILGIDEQTLKDAMMPPANGQTPP